MTDSTISRQLYKFTISGMSLVLAISSITAFTYADSINKGVFSKDSAPYEIPYKEWVTRWWQWNLEIPQENHPRIDPTGEKCAVGQKGPVWFLTDLGGPGKVTRTCTIPAGKAILFPILSGECDYGEGGITSDSQLSDCAKRGNEYGVIEATIDNVELKNLDQYRVQSDFFNIRIPKNNIFDEGAGTYKAMVDGFFVFLEPLPAGPHDIHFKATVNNPIDSSFNFSGEITYHLIVKP